jgi:iron complex outermembrane receptor protein
MGKTSLLAGAVTGAQTAPARLTKALLLVSSSIAVLWAAPAFSQTTGAPAASRAVASAPNAGSNSTGVQEIVVTAQRRSENLQKSSLSIEVISGAALHQVKNVWDLATLTPGVVIQTTGSSPQVFIHGVGDNASDNTGIGSVASNVDGIYYARQEALGPALFDVQRIEILTGPQGTLYGRNATGGAINVLTNQPKLNDLSGYVAGDFGSFDLHREEAAVNLPIGDTVALRLAGQITDRDGYLSSGLDDDHSKALRARLLVQPNDNYSIIFNADVSQVTGNGGGFAVYPVVGGNPWRGTTAQPLILAFPTGAATGTPGLTGPTDSTVNSKNYGYNFEANADLGWAKLTLIPSFRYQQILGVEYSVNSRFAEIATTEEPTVELRLSNSNGPLKWVAGGYYYAEHLYLPDSQTSTTTRGSIFDSQRLAYAGFAQATYSLTDKLRLIGGVRYTTETVTGAISSAAGAIDDPADPYHSTGAYKPVSPDIVNTRTNYKVGAEYDLTPTSMLYVTDATGFKAGGFSGSASCGATAYKPEDLSALTGGIRNRFFDNRLQVNGEAFDWTYTNQQIAIVTVNPCGQTTQLILNPGNATMKGGNLDTIFRLTSSDTLHASVQYQDTRYDTFKITQFGSAPYTAGLGSACSIAGVPGSATLDSANCSGEELTKSPRWSGTAGYSHVFALGDNKLTFNIDGQFASGTWMDLGYGPNDFTPGYARLNTALTFASKDNWTLTVYVNNLTNAAVYSGGFVSSVLAPNGKDYYAAGIAPPLTAGVRLRMNFGS